jgi:hypothetical protein
MGTTPPDQVAIAALQEKVVVSDMLPSLIHRGGVTLGVAVNFCAF